MPASLTNVAFDCADPFRLAEFWCQVTGQQMDPELSPGDEEAWVEMPHPPNLYFNRVPEPRTVKNRVHVCLSPDLPRDREVDRLLALGASMVADRRTPDRGWAVLADPEGNEFCLLRGPADRGSDI